MKILFTKIVLNSSGLHIKEEEHAYQEKFGGVLVHPQRKFVEEEDIGRISIKTDFFESNGAIIGEAYSYTPIRKEMIKEMLDTMHNIGSNYLKLKTISLDYTDMGEKIEDNGL